MKMVISKDEFSLVLMLNFTTMNGASRLSLCPCNHLRVILIHCAQTILPKPLIQDSLRESLNVLGVSLLRRWVVIQLSFLINQLLEFSNLQTEKLEVEVKVADWFTKWLIVLLMEFGHVGMLKGLLDRDSLFRVKLEHFLAEIDCLWVLTHTEKISEVFTSLLRELLHKGFIVSVLNFVD